MELDGLNLNNKDNTPIFTLDQKVAPIPINDMKGYDVRIYDTLKTREIAKFRDDYNNATTPKNFIDYNGALKLWHTGGDESGDSYAQKFHDDFFNNYDQLSSMCFDKCYTRGCGYAMRCPIDEGKGLEDLIDKPKLLE